MEVENPRIGNGEEDGDVRRSNGDGGGGGGTLGRLYGWPSSRIVRVSRASGGKDRHSKVWTSKGLRDRRVRLSVNTAVQFYDLQDRLGYDQPSKAVEWLLKAAAPFIDELPSLNASYPDTLQLSDGRKPKGGGGRELLHSSPSDNSKGSGGFSLSRSSEYPLLALDRTGAGKEKSKENVEPMNSISQNSSFTELLTSGCGGGSSAVKGESEFFSVDYVTTGLLNHSSAHQIHLGNPLMNPRVSSSLFSAGENQFSFAQHNNPNDYNLNFSISTSSSSSTCLAAFRGTLQSNSSSSLSVLPPHLQRFHPIDGTPTGFFAAAAPTAPPVDSHHHFLHGLDARLQLYYGDPQSDHKPKGKN